jgi:hypothetical protein
MANRQAMLTRVGTAMAFAALMAATYTLIGQRGGVEAFEVGKDRTADLPAGKEADGIIGDFVLRNEKIHALIGGNLPDRRANMSTEYAGVTPGSLYDLDLRGAANDQITVFRPGQLLGPLSWVRVVKDGRDGEAVVESVRTAAAGNRVFTRHEYKIAAGWQHLVVTSVWRNESRQAVEITPRPAWKEFSERWDAGKIHVGDAIDAFDKRAYAWVELSGDFSEKISLAPGGEHRVELALAMSDSPLAAYGMAAALQEATGTVTGVLRDADHSAVFVEVGGKAIPAYPDKEGRFRFQLPAGRYTARFADIGRDVQSKELMVRAGTETSLDFQIGAATAVQFAIKDEAGQPSPGKVQFLGRNGTKTPNFGTDYRAHGGNHQYQTHDGRFTQQVPPGDYLIRITRGPEYDLVEREISVAKGQTVSVAATMKRTVQTPGWISTDFHAHSTPSGDNYCNTRDRIINFAAEHIEFAPTTEHNRIYDWGSTIDELGLSGRIKTIIGLELTGRGQHFNSFPLKRAPFEQDGGSPKWSTDPRVTALLLREAFDGGAERWVQANHPIVSEVFNDRNRDGVEDGGYVGFDRMIDAAEVWSTEILNLNPTYTLQRNGKETVIENRTFGWLQMLNQGRHVWCVAVSDSHRIFGNGAGGWRMYVPSSTDEPSQINPDEIIKHSKAGRMVLTNGPFLEVTADGHPIGATIISAGGVKLRVKVQAADWMDVDRVQVLVNGRPLPEYNFTRARHGGKFKSAGTLRFDEEIDVKLQRDAHLIVVAIGENSSLEKGWGLSWESGMKPMAYTNPIYVDVDGKGFQANGDTLGHPILVARRGGQ